MKYAVPRFVTAGVLLCALVVPGAAAAAPVDELGAYSLASVGSEYPPSGWRSSLYPRDWSPGFADSEGRAIADFSYAGYRYGVSAIPTKEASLTVDVTRFPFRANNRGTKDATKALQTAIDYVASRGGGVVYLPPGTYRVRPPAGRSEALCVTADNVVVRGAGREKTFLLNTSTSMNRKTVLAVRPPVAGRWWMPPAGEPNLAADARAGSMSVRVWNPSAFQVGDLIVIRTEATPEWVASMGSPDGWDARLMDATTYLRRVTAVDPDGRIGIDIPLRTDVLVRDIGTQPNVYPARRHLREVGVEDLSIGMLEHPDDSTLAANAHEASAVRVTNVIDGWVARVGTFAPPENRGGSHILSEGIWLNDCRNVTVQDCLVRYPQYRGGGNGDGFLIRGSDNLLERCSVVGARHSYSFAYWHTTGNVVRDSSGSHASLASDFHAWLSAVNLVEGMRLDGDWIDASYRYDGTALQHGPTTSQSMIWNTVGLAPPIKPGYGFPGAVVHSVQWGWGAVAGTSGRYFGVLADPGTDGWRADGYIDVIEGVGQGRTLLPSSLSRDQTGRRLGCADYAEPVVHGAVLSPHVDQRVIDGHGIASEPWIGVRGPAQWQLGFQVPPGSSITRARLAVYGRSRIAGGAVGVYPATTAASGLPSTPLATAVRTAEKPSAAWVFDVTDLVRALARAEATSTVGLRVREAIPGLGVQFATGSGPLELRPRLEIERSPGRRLAVAQPVAANSALTDGNIRTSHTSRACGSVVTLDLGSAKSVTGVGVAFAGGARRFGFSELRTSMDGVNFRPARDLLGGGETDALQVFELDEPVQARYVRLVGYGTSDPDAPYVTALGEVEVYGQ